MIIYKVQTLKLPSVDDKGLLYSFNCKKEEILKFFIDIY